MHAMKDRLRASLSSAPSMGALPGTKFTLFPRTLCTKVTFALLPSTTSPLITIPCPDELLNSAILSTSISSSLVISLLLVHSIPTLTHPTIACHSPAFHAPNILSEASSMVHRNPAWQSPPYNRITPTSYTFPRHRTCTFFMRHA